jgi:hypothetical protein
MLNEEEVSFGNRISLSEKDIGLGFDPISTAS